MIDLSKIKALRNLQILVLGNAIDYPLPDWLLQLIAYINNVEMPLNILVKRSVTYFR